MSSLINDFQKQLTLDMRLKREDGIFAELLKNLSDQQVMALYHMCGKDMMRRSGKEQSSPNVNNEVADRLGNHLMNAFKGIGM